MDIVVSNRVAEKKEISNLDFVSTPYLQSLFPFYKGDFEEYVDFIQNTLNIPNDEFEQANSFDEVLQRANKHRELIINSFKNINIDKFDSRLLDVINAKSLPNVNETDFFKLTFNLSNYSNENVKQQIKDVFLQTNTDSFIDFKNIDGDDLEIYYYKRGIYDDNEKIVIANARDRVTLANNFAEAKDNNFICSKFISKMSYLLSDKNIDFLKDSFVSEYFNGTQKVQNKRSIKEIIYFDKLTKEEKKEALNKEKLNKVANEIAKQELKDEANLRRNSLKAGSNDKQIENAITNISLRVRQRAEEEQTAINTSNIDKIEEISKENLTISQQSIDDIIKKSFEIYKQKEREKTEIRLNKAQKDSENAYFDLKKNLQENLSIIDALDYIRQKYGNEDTIRFASFQFSQDILNVNFRDNEIKDLKSIIKELNEKIKEHDNIIEKKEHHISELKSAIAKKSNEVTQLKEDLENQQNDFKFSLEKQADYFSKQTNEQIDRVTKEFEKIIADKERDLDESDDIIRGLEDELNNANEKNKELEDKVSEISAINAKTEFYEQEAKNLLEKNKELMVENAELKSNGKITSILEAQLEKSNAQVQILMDFLKGKNQSQSQDNNQQVVTKTMKNLENNDEDNLNLENIIIRKKLN